MSAVASCIRASHIDAQMSDPEVSSPSLEAPGDSTALCVPVRYTIAVVAAAISNWPPVTPVRVPL